MLFEFTRSYSREQGLRRHQIKYFIIGVILSCVGGATNIPLWYHIPVPPIGNIFVGIGFLFLFYGFVRYRLMDLRSVVMEVLIYIVDAVYVYVFLYIAYLLISTLYGGLLNQAAYFTSAILIAIFLLALFRLDKKLRAWSTKHLFMKLYEYQSTLAQLSEDLNKYLDLNKIIELIVDTTKNTMQLDRAGILLVDPDTKPLRYQIAKVIGFDTNNGISLVEDNFLTRHLQETKRALVRDELNALYRDTNSTEEQKSIRNLEQQMTRIEASLCIPLMSRGKIIGIIVLGSKITGDAYTEEDLTLLTTLANQAGLAIENAWLYQKVQRFYETLAERVDKQTEQIRNKNTELEELVQIKDEFLRIVNHQLNTPISIIKNALSMMDEGTLDQTEGMENIKVGFERIDKTVSDFWKAFDMEGTVTSTQFSQTDIMAIVLQQLKEKGALKEVIDRKLNLSIQKPDFKLPLLWCNAENITHVLSNLLDNAVSYTEKGGVTISYELVDDKNSLKINITDTGHGLSEEDKTGLFNKFSRGTGAKDLKPNGSGLGLYIAKKFTESNHGTLTFSSDGMGKGSTFSVILPVYINQDELAGK
jgi:signal transduction histidine kinase